MRLPERYKSLAHPLFVWKSVRFRPGELKAIGYIRDSAAAVHIRRTPGPPSILTIMPDDTVIAAGGDMTRVVVTAADPSGQVVPQANVSVSLSVSGPGDFLGETPIALENGRTAFFVKTREAQAGVVVCRAVAQKMAEAQARITVHSE